MGSGIGTVKERPVPGSGIAHGRNPQARASNIPVGDQWLAARVVLSLEFLKMSPGTPIACHAQPIDEDQRTCRPLAVLMMLVRPEDEVGDIVQMVNALARLRRTVKDALAHLAGQAGQTMWRILQCSQ